MGSFETVLAGNLTSFLSAAGAFYELAGYIGNVDVGIAVTDSSDVVSDSMHQQAWRDSAYPTASFRSTVLATELTEQPRAVAIALPRLFFDALNGYSYEPRI